MKPHRGFASHESGRDFDASLAGILRQRGGQTPSRRDARAPSRGVVRKVGCSHSQRRNDPRCYRSAALEQSVVQGCHDRSGGTCFRLRDSPQRRHATRPNDCRVAHRQSVCVAAGTRPAPSRALSNCRSQMLSFLVLIQSPPGTRLTAMHASTTAFHTVLQRSTF